MAGAFLCPQRILPRPGPSCPDAVWLQMFPLAPLADEVINCQLVCVKRCPSFMLCFSFASPLMKSICTLPRFLQVSHDVQDEAADVM